MLFADLLSLHHNVQRAKGSKKGGQAIVCSPFIKIYIISSEIFLNMSVRKTLGVILIVLKLIGVVHFGWIWVLFPFWSWYVGWFVVVILDVLFG